MNQSPRWKTLVTMMAVLFGVCAAAAAQTSPDRGFKKIFNGENLEGWEGDPRLWSVQDGVIRGETTKNKKAHGNSFLVWKGGRLRNFILKLRFRVEKGNSGVQYRSQEKEKWRVVGYQADVDNQLGDVGELYDERKRGHLARVGQFTVIDDSGKPDLVGSVASKSYLKEKGYYEPGEWNQYTIIARGNHLAQYINGYQTVEVLDNDPDGRDMEGVLALQLHSGKPMAVEYKDIRLKQLDDDYGTARRLFNGKNLDGWTCPTKGGNKAWQVRDGVLVTDGKPRSYVRTDKKYTNYVLRIQYRHVTKGNGGVMLRMHGGDRVWPTCIEAQGRWHNVGVIYNIGKFPMKTDPARSRGRRTAKMHKPSERPLGEWNNYEMVLSGGDLRLYVNRVLQNRASECAEIPGYIGFQAEGCKMEFRNIVLIPIKEEQQD